MPIAWTAEMDRKLLLAILKVHDFPIDKTKVAEELSTEDQPCTSMAIQKRLQAIKVMIKNGTDGDRSPKAKTTPRKRGAATASADDQSPTKKRKKIKGKDAKATETADAYERGAKKVTVKEEDADWDELTV